ncbi:hypothetical protein CkaCkLH20_00533 [Colletotrichum karsti]|uniref:Uncharacterized protein n=1 Tax=Colletotrichum karsti TaxID=1095194 RepID=A0A9P6LRD9_9PEZI|nr:uncharacterized protein CkaCkLH20_00533 [Colletotrichum karsti]KAF9882497.1 hypothetical protein CkaCkLH20_00533 [Colletotrichum karsti]
MRITSATKAIFIMVNHVMASHFPREVFPEARIFGRGDFETGLAARQAGSLPNIWKCNDCIDKCNSPSQIVDPKDCKKCTECPKGQKPDKAGTKCIDDDKQKKFEEQRKKRYSEYKTSKGYDRWKKIKEREYENKVNEEKRRKVRRMSRCLAIVPLAMGAAEVEQFADLFDEDWTESMEMLEFWPGGLEIDEWIDQKSDEIFEQDEYLDKWVNIGNGEKRDMMPAAAQFKPSSSLAAPAITPAPYIDHEKVPNKFVRDAATTTALIVRDSELDKRCPFCFLIPIFAAVVRTVAQVAVRVAKVAKNAVKISKGMNKRDRRDKRKASEEISKNKNWRNCLTGANPV